MNLISEATIFSSSNEHFHIQISLAVCGQDAEMNSIDH